MSGRRLRVLSYTTLFPSKARPMRGLFVARRMARVARHADVTVVAPVPLRLRAHGGAASAVPEVSALRVLHPSYWLPPGFAKAWHDRLLFLQTRSAVRSLGADSFDVLDAQYAYPDGSAGRLIAAWLGKPYVLTVRGSDLHVLAQDPSRRPAIQETLRRASAVVAVSKPLAKLAETLGAAPRRVHWIPNGVDREQFRPRPRVDARAALGWEATRPSILFVGRLDPIKGIGLLLDAVEVLRLRKPTITCYLAGEGPLRADIERRIQARGLQGSVILLGEVPPERLALCYAASDLLCLPSVSEGSPNVVLESLASGTPVVSADVGDVAELVDGAGGEIVRERTAEEFARATASVLSRAWDAEAVAALVSDRDWDRVGAAQLEVYRSVLGAT